jgi:hypothetical protein
VAAALTAPAAPRYPVAVLGRDPVPKKSDNAQRLHDVIVDAGQDLMMRFAPGMGDNG